MSEYELETRLLGKEDINFDTEGTNAQTEFVDLNGDSHTITKLNASHIPLTQAARAVVDGAENVNSAIQVLHDDIQNVAEQNGVGMGADKTIVLETASTRQTLISAQFRNLGGHTLTFKFPEEGDVNVATAPLEFQGFYNGVLIIDLNGCDIHDNGTFSPEGVLRIKNCHSIVRIIGDGRSTSGYGKVIFTDNHYGIAIIHSPSCAIEHIAFESSSGANDYALYTESANAFFTSCTFTGCKHQNMKSIYRDYVDDHMSDANAHASLFAGKADLVHTHSMTAVSGLVDALGGKAALVHSHAVEDISGFSSDTFSSAQYADSAGYTDSTGYASSAGALVYGDGTKTAEELLVMASSNTVAYASSAGALVYGNGTKTAAQLLTLASSNSVTNATYANHLGGATKAQVISSAVDAALSSGGGGGAGFIAPDYLAFGTANPYNNRLSAGVQYQADANGYLRISFYNEGVQYSGCCQMAVSIPSWSEDDPDHDYPPTYNTVSMGLYQFASGTSGGGVTIPYPMSSGWRFMISQPPTGASVLIMYDHSVTSVGQD